MASNFEVACNWDSVNSVTVDVATGPVLYHLGRALSDGVRRLRLIMLHNEAAQWQTTDAVEVDRLFAEAATMNERKEQLEFLLDKAADKFKAELVALYSSLRRGPQAIAAAVDAEWDQLSDSASVFDVDYPSCLETETDAESQPGTIDTGRTSRSFSVIDSSDEATVAADSSSEDERTEPAAARHRSATPPQASSSSSAMAQPHEFGPQPVPSSGTPTTAQHTRPQRSTVQERLERPAATPWDAPAQPSPLPSVAPPAPSTVRPVQPQPERARPSSSSSSREGHASAPSSQPPVAAADAAKGLAEALYDMLEYNNQIFGYVAGLAVPVVPEDFDIFSADQLRAFRDVADHRRRQAVDAVNAANVRKQYLMNSRSSDGEALLAVVTEITVHEAARDRADRLCRVLSYAWYHRFEGISDERESQKRLIAFERERLRAGGAPIYWCQSDADEARRFSTWTDAIWHPAAVPSPQPAPAPRRTSSRARSRSRVSFHPSSQTSASAAHRSGRAYRSPPPPPRSLSQSWSSSQSRTSSPPARNPWAPRDESSLARQQYRDRINRLRLQRQGRWHGIPPCRTIHVSPFNKHQNKATLQRLMRRHGFDLDSDTAVVEYHVTSSQRSGKFHYYGFVTFADLDAAKLCVHELDRMDFDGHQGMTPIIKHDDGTVGHDILTFSFSKRNQNLDVDADAGDMDSRRRRRSSSRAPPARRQGRAATPARRQPSRAPVYDTDSDETGLEDY